MSFSVPQNALIVIATGTEATYYRNTDASGISIKKVGELSPSSGGGQASAVPTETAPREAEEANFAKHIADDLYQQAHQGKYDALVLIADPQTLGQIRPSLHKEVTQRITGELNKTLNNSTVSDIEQILTKAVA